MKDQYDQEVHVHTEDQDLNQCRLYIPNLKNFDGYGSRRKSSVMITSVDQTILGRKIFNDIEVPTPTSDNMAGSKKYVDANYVAKSGATMTGSLIVQKDNYPVQGDLNKVISYEAQREIFLSKKEGGVMEQTIDMNGFTIDNLPLPTTDDNACSKAYVDNKINSKADTSDLDDYFKLDGTKAMAGNINMEGNRILRLPDPTLSDEPATLGYVSKLNNNLFNSYLDLNGIRKMTGNLDMNNNAIINIKTPVNDSDATNKQYVDFHLIQLAHPLKNVFEYIMNDVDQTTSEYGIEVDKIDNLILSFHSYNKKVIFLKLLKDGNNYRSRIGYNIYKLVDKSKDRYYTAVIEWLTTDNNAWNKMQIYHNMTSGSIISNQTKKFETPDGVYYTRSIVQIKVLSISEAPLYLLSTIHIDGVNPTYPAKFTEVYNIIYGTNGSHIAINPNVYDAHTAFEIGKTKMKMLVPLDMNNKAITNIPNLSNYGLMSIYGKVGSDKYFRASDIQLAFRNVYIVYINIYGSRKLQSKQDVLNVEIRNLTKIKYQFTFPSLVAHVHIQINKFFEGINNIQFSNSSDVAFQLTYKLFY